MSQAQVRRRGRTNRKPGSGRKKREKERERERERGRREEKRRETVRKRERERERERKKERERRGDRNSVVLSNGGKRTQGKAERRNSKIVENVHAPSSGWPRFSQDLLSRQHFSLSSAARERDV
ncbi:uncharacterized protein [Anoplolepis gracilipes]|uniref:uncharacterized protein n=1 Tax=Anoplolepis gracilipes TaxID=354296 RepID=UPI003B9F04A0